MFDQPFGPPAPGIFPPTKTQQEQDREADQHRGVTGIILQGRLDLEAVRELITRYRIAAGTAYTNGSDSKAREYQRAVEALSDVVNKLPKLPG